MNDNKKPLQGLINFSAVIASISLFVLPVSAVTWVFGIEYSREIFYSALIQVIFWTYIYFALDKRKEK